MQIELVDQPPWSVLLAPQIALYTPDEHRRLATRFGQDIEVVILSNRSLVLWLLGYQASARIDAEHALQRARESGLASTLMYALGLALIVNLYDGDYDVSKPVGRRTYLWRVARMRSTGRH